MTSSNILALVLTPPGKRRNISKFLKASGNKVYDIDSRLCDNLGFTNLRQAITGSSRILLQQKWNQVIENIINSISMDEHESDQLYLLLGQTLYYNDSTREFFSLFDSRILEDAAKEKNITISKTVLIIDDIYDTFSDLSKPSELYGNSALSDFINDYSKELRSGSSEQTHPKLYLSWLHYCLNSVLNWRLQEVILAQNIARQLQSKFMLWGLKQDPNVMLEWLQNNNKLFYLSHPISEPRRNFHVSGKWPDLVQTINNFQVELRNKAMLIAMPTAIDEFRFEKDLEYNYTSKLITRWPLLNSIQTILLTYNLIDNDIDKKDIVVPHSFEFQNGSVLVKGNVSICQLQDYVNGILNTLEMSIREQLGNRDHLLVWLTDGVIVLDPYSLKERKIHGGVQKELDYLRRVNMTLKEPKRLFAIFLKSSVTSIIQEDDFKSGLNYQLARIISKQHDLRQIDVSSSLDQNGDLVHHSSSLGPQYISRSKLDDIKPHMNEYKDNAIIIQFVNKALLLDEDDLKFIMVIILDNMNKLMDINVVDKIRQFLVNGNIDERWKDELVKLSKV